MLGLSMEMESELGIDSIKQVEILAALQTHFPGAPEVPASELARLRTLQDVVDSIAGLGSDDNPGDAAGVDHSASSGSGASGSGSSGSTGSSSAGLVSTEAIFGEVPPSGLTMAGLRDGEVLITREDPAFADDLERVMTSHGIKARAVDDVPAEAAAVISLAALSPVRTPQDCVDMHVRAFHAARSVAKSNSRSRLFVTVQSTGAHFAGADVPVGVASLVKTAAWEWPNASVRAIDLETLDATRLTQELLAGGSGIEVALRNDGTRLVLADTAVSDVAGSHSASDTISVAPGGVVVVTGGARGVTAGSALALAARHGLRLALLGRTPLHAAAPDEPSGTTTAEIATALVAAAKARGESMTLPQARAAADSLLAQREVRATLAAAEQQGIAARYFSADINNGTELRGVLDEVRQNFGPIAGVVHGAGVLADKRLEDLDDEQFIKVFSTKVVGGEALLDATASDDLRFISLFSSIAARAGNPGQAAYAAANAVLESIAARESDRRGADCVVRAFGWGPWDGGMVDATLKSRFLEAGVGVIGLDDGARFFAEHALDRSGATAIVVAAPAENRLRAARLEWDVSTETLPVLVDHQVRGRVVVPVVIVLDAMLRAVRPLVPTAATVVRDFQVLSGMVFGEAEIQSLTIDLEPAGSSYIVSVEDFQGRKRYRAVIDLNATDAMSAGGPVPQISGSSWPMSVDDAYTGPLFHGRSFAAIEALDVLGSAGCTARLRGLRELGWPGDAWAIDPVIVDGGLQLAILWASANGLPLVLPQRIGRVALHRPFGDDSVHCRLAAHPVSDKRVDYDIAFETADGTLVAELSGVEFYVAGSGADSPA
jgi:short-subunit dehydrogenase